MYVDENIRVCEYNPDFSLTGDEEDYTGEVEEEKSNFESYKSIVLEAPYENVIEMYDRYESVPDTIPEVLWRQINNIALGPQMANSS